LSELFQSGDALLLITPAYSDSEVPVGRKPELEVLDPAARYWRTLPLHVEDDRELCTFIHLYASRHTWEAHSFDDLLRLVADNKVADVSILRLDIACAYHPYDGGADVITEVAMLRNELADKYRNWLPTA
jgi:hypothetical protein